MGAKSSRVLVPRLAAASRRGVFFCGVGMVSAVAWQSYSEPKPLLCKPKDTPSYLVPWYLQSIRARFNHYASVTKEGQRYMTAEDFFRSLLVLKKKDDSAEDAIPSCTRLEKLFKTIDANSDGLLSFAEYSLFITILSCPKKDFELLFKMFDLDESGTIDLPEFKQIMFCANPDKTVSFDFEGGLMNVFFGAKHDRRLQFAKFYQFVEQLRDEVACVEFGQYDPKNAKVISAEQFCKLITSSMLGSHLPFYIVQNVRRIRGKDNVALSTWLSFNKLMSISDELGAAIQLYATANLPIKKKDFARAVRSVSSHKLSNEEIDLIYAIFDRDGNGSLEFDEFLTVMNNKYHFNTGLSLQRPSETKRNWVQSLFYCMQQS